MLSTPISCATRWSPGLPLVDFQKVLLVLLIHFRGKPCSMPTTGEEFDPMNSRSLLTSVESGLYISEVLE